VSDGAKQAPDPTLPCRVLVLSSTGHLLGSLSCTVRSTICKYEYGTGALLVLLGAECWLANRRARAGISMLARHVLRMLLAVSKHKMSRALSTGIGCLTDSASAWVSLAGSITSPFV
jgi:hypothetical protein